MLKDRDIEIGKKVRFVKSLKDETLLFDNGLQGQIGVIKEIYDFYWRYNIQVDFPNWERDNILKMGLVGCNREELELVEGFIGIDLVLGIICIIQQFNGLNEV